MKKNGYSLKFFSLTALSLSLFLGIQPLLAEDKFSGTKLIAQAASRNQMDSSYDSYGQLKQSLPQKSLARELIEKTSLNYYHQFLGPTLDGETSSTYNVFQEGIDSPGTGKAPLQSFHAVSLRHQLNSDWSFGVSLAAVNGYSDEVSNQSAQRLNFINGTKTTFFNARAFVSLPAWKSTIGTLYTTLSYEHPTSEIAQDDDMNWAWVASGSYAFTLPTFKWYFGLQGQIYRLYYKNNIKAPTISPELGGRPIALQTMIISGGPYLNYRFHENWMLGSTVTFDWDQRGIQSSSRDFNNNLSDRARVNLTYFPSTQGILQSISLFSQALLKYRPKTTALGADFALKF